MKNKIYWSGHKLYHEPAALMLTLRQVGLRYEATCLGRTTWFDTPYQTEARQLAEKWFTQVLLEIIEDVKRLGEAVQRDGDGEPESDEGAASP